MREKSKYVCFLCVAIAALIIGLCVVTSIRASAQTEAVQTNVSAFTTLQGEQRYIQAKYADNYYLDMEDTDFWDGGYAILNIICNMFFTIIKLLARMTVTLFYFCMDFDVAALFGSQISDIQEALNSGIFKPMFLLGFAATALVLLKKYIRRDLAGALGQIVKVVFLVVLSMLVVRESGTVLSYTTKITKSISAQAVTGMNGGGQNISSFAASCSGVLWVNLIHQPWLSMEFGADAVSDANVDFLMQDGNEPDSEARDKFIKNYQGEAFRKQRIFEKLGLVIVYVIPFLVKCAIYIAVSLIQLIFQFIALFYVILAPIILILSMFPGYEGMLGAWVRKILESQLSILIITFLMGLLIKFDSMLATLADDIGWMIVMIIQAIVAVGAVMKREQILSAFSKMQHAVASPGYAMAMMRKGVDGVEVAKGGAKVAKKATRVYGGYLRDKAVDIAQGANEMGSDMYHVGKTIADGMQANRQIKIMQAAGSYSMDTEKKSGASQKVSETQIRRPRLDNIVPFRDSTDRTTQSQPEAAAKEESRERMVVRRPRSSVLQETTGNKAEKVNIEITSSQKFQEECSEPQIKAERPRMEKTAKTTEKPKKEAYRVSERVRRVKNATPRPKTDIQEESRERAVRQPRSSVLQETTGNKAENVNIEITSSHKAQEEGSEPQIKAERPRMEKSAKTTEKPKNEAYRESERVRRVKAATPQPEMTIKNEENRESMVRRPRSSVSVLQDTTDNMTEKVARPRSAARR